MKRREEKSINNFHRSTFRSNLLKSVRSTSWRITRQDPRERSTCKLSFPPGKFTCDSITAPGSNSFRGYCLTSWKILKVKSWWKFRKRSSLNSGLKLREVLFFFFTREIVDLEADPEGFLRARFVLRTLSIIPLLNILGHRHVVHSAKSRRLVYSTFPRQGNCFKWISNGNVL